MADLDRLQHLRLLEAINSYEDLVGYNPEFESVDELKQFVKMNQEIDPTLYTLRINIYMQIISIRKFPQFVHIYLADHDTLEAMQGVLETLQQLEHAPRKNDFYEATFMLTLWDRSVYFHDAQVHDIFKPGQVIKVSNVGNLHWFMDISLCGCIRKNSQIVIMNENQADHMEDKGADFEETEW